jgi:hypothetical protein
MNQKIFALVLSTLLFAPWLVAEAQQQANVPRVGMLVSGGQQRVDNFQQALRELGYIKGKSIIIERRNPEARAEKYPELVLCPINNFTQRR